MARTGCSIAASPSSTPLNRSGAVRLQQRQLEGPIPTPQKLRQRMRNLARTTRASSAQAETLEAALGGALGRDRLEAQGRAAPLLRNGRLARHGGLGRRFVGAASLLAQRRKRCDDR